MNRTTSLRRPVPSKPRKQNYHMSSEFGPQTANNMLQNFIKEVSELITEKTIVTTHIDDTGVSMVVSGSNMQFSLIYQEGGQS